MGRSEAKKKAVAGKKQISQRADDYSPNHERYRMDWDILFEDIKERFNCNFEVGKIQNELKSAALDNSIFYNLVTSSLIAVLMVALFFIIRKKMKFVYFCKHFFNSGKIGPLWFRNSAKIPDSNLIHMVGIDSFLFLETLKFLFYLLFGFFSISGLILLPVFLSNGVDPKNIFVSLSILNVKKEKGWIFWIIVIVAWVFSYFAMNSLELFYQRFVDLRQRFLEDPASLHAVEYVENVSVSYMNYRKNAPFSYQDSMQHSQKMFDVAPRTIIAKSLPSHVTNNAALIEYAAELNLGTVEFATIVYDSNEFFGLLNDRQKVVSDLENAYNKLFLNVLKKIERSIKMFSPNSSVSACALCSSYYDFANFTKEEKEQLLERIVSDTSFLEECRPLKRVIFSFNRDTKSIDLISYHAYRLEEITQKIIELKKTLENELLRPSTVEGAVTAENQPSRNQAQEQSVEEEDNLADKQGYSFYRLKDFFALPYKNSFRTKKTGIITFSTATEANQAKQCLLEDRSIHTQFLMTPIAPDIIWYNLRTYADTKFRYYFGEIFYILIVLFWSIPISLVSVLTDPQTLGIALPNIGLTLKQEKFIKSIWAGFVTPTLLTVVIAIVPYLLNSISIYQGFSSRTKVSSNSARMYSWFLFIQPFLFTLISGSFIGAIRSISLGKYCDVMSDFQETLMEKSSFFFNYVVQRATLDMGLLLLRPADLFLKVIFLMFKSSPRSTTASIAPSIFPFAFSYPKIVSIFPMVIIYGCTSPILLFIGALYYLVSYQCHLYCFLNIFTPSIDSGGLYWKAAYRIILISIILSCASTIMQLLLVRAYLAGLFLVPAIAYIISRGSKIRHNFSPYIKFQPVIKKNTHNSFDQHCTEMRKDVVKSMCINEEEPTSKPFLIAECTALSRKLNQRDISSEMFYRMVNVNSFYSNPFTHSIPDTLFFPDYFFEVLKYYIEKYLNKTSNISEDRIERLATSRM